jgi:hypothetical protein
LGLIQIAQAIAISTAQIANSREILRALSLTAKLLTAKRQISRIEKPAHAKLLLGRKVSYIHPLLQENPNDTDQYR